MPLPLKTYGLGPFPFDARGRRVVRLSALLYTLSEYLLCPLQHIYRALRISQSLAIGRRSPFQSRRTDFEGSDRLSVASTAEFVNERTWLELLLGSLISGLYSS
jgi:hypothetical protein